MLRLRPREHEVNQKLQQCFERRGELLQEAAYQGIEVEPLRSLADHLNPDDSKLDAHLDQVSQRMRLLQHHSLTNWVLAQRSLLHVSQLLEIIATGGRLKPTYGKGESAMSKGSLVDEAG